MNSNKICFVIPNYITRLVGGAELQVYLIATELQSRGWEIEVISSYTQNKKIVHSQYLNPLIKHHYYSRSKIIFTEFFKVLLQLYKTKSYYYFQRTDYP